MAALDVQDPLPEPSMLWRRWITIAWVLGNTILMAVIIHKLIEARPLMWVALALCLLNALLSILYFGGASANDLARIVQSAAIVKGAATARLPGGASFDQGASALTPDPGCDDTTPATGPREV